MNLQIITHHLQLHVFGFEGVASNKDHTSLAFSLSKRMWEIIKTNGIKNKGKNIWIYGADDIVFAGVELDSPSGEVYKILQQKQISLDKYAYYKHVGAYRLIKEQGQAMIAELNSQKHKIIPPYIEIYGHWNSDENLCETELIMNLV